MNDGCMLGENIVFEVGYRFCWVFGMEGSEREKVGVDFKKPGRWVMFIGKLSEESDRGA